MSSKITTEQYTRYVDEEGYTNITYQSPDTKMVIRYKGDKMSYWYNSELIYSGRYSKELASQAERRFYGNTKLDDFAQFEKVSYADLFNSANQSSSSNKNSSPKLSPSDWGCCLGCLVSFVIITIGICVILYAMGWLGGEFVSFLRDFFGSLF